MATVGDNNYQHGTIWLALATGFVGLLFLLVFQFMLHISQTKDLQRRVGVLEQQVEALTHATTREGGE